MRPRWRGSLASSGSANRFARRVAAGEPTATSTGRHHNVREEEPDPAAEAAAKAEPAGSASSSGVKIVVTR
jgi:hypothetical protein